MPEHATHHLYETSAYSSAHPDNSSSFDIMGTTAEVVAHGLSQPATLAALSDARSLLQHAERLWSRFIPTSDVSRVNALAGEWVAIHRDTYDLAEVAALASELTSYRFQPLVGAVLRDNGYRISYRNLPRTGSQPLPDRIVTRSGVSPSKQAFGQIEFSPDATAIRIPRHTSLDFGGIAKGWAADLVCQLLIAAGCTGALCNLGGDVCTSGEAPEGVWRVDVHLGQGREPVTIVLNEGAVAVSSTAARTWTHGGNSWHHLIDPATGIPTEIGGTAAVIAGSGWWAEVLTKVALCSGERPNASSVERCGHGAHALVVPDDGSPSHTSDWSRFVREYVGPSPLTRPLTNQELVA